MEKKDQKSKNEKLAGAGLVMKLIKYFQKGRYFFDNEDYISSISWLNKALKLDADHVQSLHVRALAKSKLVDYAGSVEDFNHALSLDPDNAVILSDRALVYHFMGEKEKSMADFDRAVLLEPENGYRYASRAFIKDRLGDLQGALEDYNRAIALDPEDAISINNKGMVEEKMGYANMARKSFSQADELESILKLNDIEYAPESERTDLDTPPHSAVKSPESQSQPASRVSISAYFKVAKGIFTSKKELGEFIRFCKNLFKS